MAAGQRPIAEAALKEPAGSPAWKTIPSWFVYGSADKNIPAAALGSMAERAGSKATVVVKGASHIVMVSHPEPAPTTRSLLRLSTIAEASRHQPVQPFGECTCVCRALAVQDAGGIQEQVGYVVTQGIIFDGREG